MRRPTPPEILTESPPVVLLAHPDGAMHELAVAALGARYDLKLSRTQGHAVKTAAAAKVAVAIISVDLCKEPEELVERLRELQPATAIIFVLGKRKAPPSLAKQGVVLPATVDGARLRSAVDRVCSQPAGRRTAPPPRKQTQAMLPAADAGPGGTEAPTVRPPKRTGRHTTLKFQALPDPPKAEQPARRASRKLSTAKRIPRSE